MKLSLRTRLDSASPPQGANSSCRRSPKGAEWQRIGSRLRRNSSTSDGGGTVPEKVDITKYLQVY